MSRPTPRASVPAGCLWTGFCALFAVAGAMIFFFGFARPAWRTAASRSWTKTPCVVVESTLDSKPSDEHTVYRVVIRYRYDVAGKSYESDRYDFSAGHTNVGLSAMRNAVALHPVGATRTCYVDPADPTSAVINRKLRLTTWIALPSSGMFLLVGVGGLAFIRLNQRRHSVRRATLVPTGTIETFPADKIVASALGATAVTVFWNGIVSVFLMVLIDDWNEQQTNSLGWFLIPFVLIGIGFAIATIYYVLAALVPQPRVTVGGTLAPDGMLSLDWDYSRRVRGLRTLIVTLNARRERVPANDDDAKPPPRVTPHWSVTLYAADPFHVATSGRAWASASRAMTPSPTRHARSRFRWATDPNVRTERRPGPSPRTINHAQPKLKTATPAPRLSTAPA